MNLIHFTTVHPRNDTRIRLKQAMSLAQAFDANVMILVQDGKGDEVDLEHNIKIVDTGPRPTGSRIARMTKGAWRMYRALRHVKPDVAHFHDPELIIVGVLLRLAGVKVIYDVHEDLPRQILSKPYIPASLRKPIGWIAGGVEWLAGLIFNGIIPATPTIAERFPAHRTVLGSVDIHRELMMAEHRLIIPLCQGSCPLLYFSSISQVGGIGR